ncbi:MAG TPA: proline racemase family protein [Acidobacteriaceae bacterium]|jgi:4-hydroxyproline epimerase
MADGASRKPVQVIDSHTAGEPTRVVIAGGPPLGESSLQSRLEQFRLQHDSFRRAVLCEPRGSDVIVGALLCTPCDPAAAAGVIFFNDVGYLGMCGHGSIGLIATLAHLGRIAAGTHRIETPVGTIATTLHSDGAVSIVNVPSYRYRSAVKVDVPQYGIMHGDIAWGGNWFFLVADHGMRLRAENRDALVAAAKAVRTALEAAGMRGEGGAPIDHIEFIGPAEDPANSGRNFVLCPGAAFDRSPCGTGTSAKMACLYADGKLQPGQTWRQEGILGTVFEGSIDVVGDVVTPTIKGSAYISAESTLLFDERDPFHEGIAF